MANTIKVLDTSFLVALFNEDDINHKKALSIRHNLTGNNLLLSEYVILELSTVLAIRGSIEISNQAIHELLSSSEVQFVPCSDIFSATMKRFYKQKKYKLSFVDCSLLEIKEKYHAGSIITFDKELSI